MNTRRTCIKSIGLLITILAVATGCAAKSCLWKVTSDTGTLYLQGSIHILKADSYPLAEAIEQAYADSELLVLETDIDEMSSPETQQRILAVAMLSGTETLQQTLNEETYEALSSVSDQAGMPIAAMEKFKPWFATMTLTLIHLQKMGFDPAHGLDLYFHGKAQADGKKVAGLETVDFQINLFDSLSMENPNDFVTRALADLTLIEEDVAELENAWMTGDIETVGRLVIKSFKDYPELHKTFVLDRNKQWVEKLNGYLKSPETCMVVVGAGHLSGKEGLLELLKKEGYTLEQL